MRLYQNNSRVIIIAVFILISLVACKSGSGKRSDSGWTADPDGFVFLKDYGKKVRVGVVTFTGYNTSLYDTAVTDHVITTLSDIDNVVLVERSRIESILKEQKLASSGLLEGEEAVLLGEMLPLDLIVTGRYSYTKDLIEGKGRFVDVVTGDIKKTFPFTLRLGRDIESSIAPDRENCEAYQEYVKEALSDLRQDHLVDEAVRRATRIPFDAKCGRIHYLVMTEFEKGKRYPDKYRQFLIDALRTNIDNPKARFMIKEILGYLTSDGEVDEVEWNAGKELLRRRWDRFLTRYLINPNRLPAQGNYDRLDDIFEMVENKEIGRPYAYTREHMLSEFLKIPHIRMREEGIDLVLYMLERYGAYSEGSEKERWQAQSSLRSIYFDTGVRSTQKRALDLLIRLYQDDSESAGSAKPYSKSISDLWSFLQKMENSIDEAKKSSVALASRKGVARKEDLLKINKELKNRICDINDHYSDSYSDPDVSRYLSRYKISCAGMVTADQLLKRFDQATSSRQKENILDELEALGDRAGPAESLAIRCMDLPGSSGANARMRKTCAKILGNIPTKNTKAMLILIDGFADLGYGVPDACMESIEHIGKPAVPYLTRKLLSSKSQVVRFRSAMVLGRMGRSARSALPALQKAASSDSSSNVRKHAEAAIRRVR